VLKQKFYELTLENTSLEM